MLLGSQDKLNSDIGPRDVSIGASTEAVDLPAFNSLALQSLGLLYDEKAKLFSQSLTFTPEGFHRGDSSRKCTIIALLGLQRLASSGVTLPFDIAAIQESVLGDLQWVRSAGDLGLLLWFVADCVPERLEGLLRDFDLGRALDAYADARHARTQGLAWFLAGLAHARMACSEAPCDLIDVAVDTYRLLVENQSDHGIFGYAKTPATIQEAFYVRRGTFADQAFAIYALSTFARSCGIVEPLESALSCANTVCALQGQKGEWWLLYDPHRGCVANRYPVYSSHQNGMAPTALLALEEVTSQSFHKPIWKGLSWTKGRNILGADLRSADHGLIWDCIEPRSLVARYCAAMCNHVHVRREPLAKNLKIRYEARPHHFGWLLYAFGKWGLSKARLETT